MTEGVDLNENNEIAGADFQQVKTRTLDPVVVTQPTFSSR